jgi:hypothetical protein
MIKMFDMRKLLPYLVLNFLVSALAVVIVLLIWDKAHQPGTPVQQNLFSPAVTNSGGSTNTDELPPLDQVTIEIQGVIGAGDLDTERIILFNISELEVSLAGWKIQDEDGHELLLPAITIYPSGGIVLHTKAGIDSAVEAYAKQDEPVFTSGEKIRLLDSQGHLRSSYIVP